MIIKCLWKYFNIRTCCWMKLEYYTYGTSYETGNENWSSNKNKQLWDILQTDNQLALWMTNNDTLATWH